MVTSPCVLESAADAVWHRPGPRDGIHRAPQLEDAMANRRVESQAIIEQGLLAHLIEFREASRAG